jgi:hypothetical protein
LLWLNDGDDELHDVISSNARVYSVIKTWKPL